MKHVLIAAMMMFGLAGYARQATAQDVASVPRHETVSYCGQPPVDIDLNPNAGSFSPFIGIWTGVVRPQGAESNPNGMCLTIIVQDVNQSNGLVSLVIVNGAFGVVQPGTHRITGRARGNELRYYVRDHSKVYTTLGADGLHYEHQNVLNDGDYRAVLHKD